MLPTLHLENLKAPNFPYPHLVSISEIKSDWASSTNEGNVLRFLRKKRFALRFLCPFDLSEVPCGYGGEGYLLTIRETRPMLQALQVWQEVWRLVDDHRQQSWFCTLTEIGWRSGLQ